MKSNVPINAIYESLNSFQSLQNMISNGEAESSYLECKSPSNPNFNAGLKTQAAKTISAFANSGGGIILWGISTTKHNDKGMDVITAIQQIGDVKKFKSQLDLYLPTLTKPEVNIVSKILLEKPEDTRGVVVTYVSPVNGDPVQCGEDNQFYLRIGDASMVMPYETIKRMFIGTAGPDLMPVIDNRIIKTGQDGKWNIPIVIQNLSSSAARDVEVSVTIKNPEACDHISSSTFRDQSSINPGVTIFMISIDKPIHRGLNWVAGDLSIKMKKSTTRLKRKLELDIVLYATNMRAKLSTVTIQVTKGSIQLKKIKSDYLY